MLRKLFTILNFRNQSSVSKGPNIYNVLKQYSQELALSNVMEQMIPRAFT